MAECYSSLDLMQSAIYSDLMGTNFVRVRVMVINSTFNNISVLLEEETRVPGENH
jgi:hypothetical protein